MSRLQQLSSFFKAIITNPRAMGTIWPSSKELANEMAEHVPKTTEGWVIELGPGTGAVTEALLEQDIDPKRLIAVEHLPSFANELRTRFPEIQVIEGSAVNLNTLLAHLTFKSIDAVVSSLPLLSLPKDTRKKILYEIDQLLSKGGNFIQYTYSYKEIKLDALKNYQKIFSKRIWLNLPPARVDVFIAPPPTLRRV